MKNVVPPKGLKTNNTSLRGRSANWSNQTWIDGCNIYSAHLQNANNIHTFSAPYIFDQGFTILISWWTPKAQHCQSFIPNINSSSTTILSNGDLIYRYWCQISRMRVFTIVPYLVWYFYLKNIFYFSELNFIFQRNANCVMISWCTVTTFVTYKAT